jgi:SAM-dependent methyltransferase
MSVDAYVGRDNLDVMEVAANYNGWLADLATAPFERNSRILDFGAGTGTVTRLLRARGLDIVAVEPDGPMAQELMRQSIPVVRTLDDVPDGQFAGVVSFNVLEHIEDDVGALRALRRKLRPHGRLFLYVPAFPILYSSMDRQVGHFRRYRRQPLARLLEQCGFRVERARYGDSLGFPAALAYRLLGARDGLLDRGSLLRYDRWVFPVSRLIDTVTCGTFGKNVIVVARHTGTV